MTLLPLALVVIVTFGAAVALVVAAFTNPILRAIETVEPSQRVRWILALLFAPWFAGVATVIAAWVPCLFEGRGGARNAVEICRFCLFHPAPGTSLVWGLGLLAAIPFARSVWIGRRGVLESRRVLATLRPMSRRDARDGHLWIPGTHSFAVGWPRSEACVGEDLAKELDSSALDAVVAHERAHVRRGDVGVRVLARVLAAGHLPQCGRTLVDALDLATELACDAEASRDVRDPLVVADALIAVARLTPSIGAARPAFAESAIETRVRALCDHRWIPTARTGVVASVLAASLGIVAFALASPLHHAAEAWVSLISR